jgi:hypothetical protein
MGKSKFNLLRLMHKYQEENNVKAMCLTNCQFFLDCMRASGLNAKAVAVLALDCAKDHSVAITTVHMVIETKDGVVDPSWEHSKNENLQYVKTLSCLDWTGCENKEIEGMSRRELVETFIEFIKYAETMNNDEDTFLITDKAYYNAQADYCEKHF